MDARAQVVAQILAFSEGSNIHKRCCWLVGHDWLRWERTHGGRLQQRECEACGIVRVKRIRKNCLHEWIDVRSGPIVAEGHKYPIGYWHELRCKWCGDLMRRNLK